MANVVNITDKLVINQLENKIGRLKAEIEVHIKSIEHYRLDNFRLMAQNDQLKLENEELKKHLKSLDVQVIYG